MIIFLTYTVEAQVMISFSSFAQTFKLHTAHNDLPMNFRFVKLSHHYKS